MRENGARGNSLNENWSRAVETKLEILATQLGLTTAETGRRDTAASHRQIVTESADPRGLGLLVRKPKSGDRIPIRKVRIHVWLPLPHGI